MKNRQYNGQKKKDKRTEEKYIRWYLFNKLYEVVIQPAIVLRILFDINITSSIPEILLLWGESKDHRSDVLYVVLLSMVVKMSADGHVRLYGQNTNAELSLPEFTNLISLRV